MNTFFDDYLKGKEEIVWKQLIDEKFDLSNSNNLEIVLKITKVAINRFKSNLEIIYNKLLQWGFVFKDYGVFDMQGKQYEFNSPDYQIDEFTDFFIPIGKLPLSFTQLYKEIKFIDFRGYFDDVDINFNNENLDPIFFDTIEGIMDFYEDLVLDEEISELDEWCISFASDKYLKYNYSGDIDYEIYLNKNLLVDNKILCCSDIEIYFMDYLRICCKYGGLFGLTSLKENEIPLKIMKYLEDVRLDIIPF